ncbi:MAG: GFA family protein [Alphaproteobacteria bacterium]
MNTPGDKDIQGSCYCGSVRFSISAGANPYWAGYCHCRDCRQAHAAPLYQYVYVREPEFRVIEGAHLLKWFTRTESRKDEFKRFFCTICGSKVYNFLIFEDNGNKIELCGTFPSLFDNQETATNSTWSPREHVYCAESIMNISSIQDDLPKADGFGEIFPI